MFDDDDVDYAVSIAYIFDDGTPPSIDTELQSRGATEAQGECSECNGTLYNHEHEVICGNCSVVIGSDTSRESGPTQWEYFNNNRSQYHNSNKYRCPGGFPHVYEWVSRDDIDHPVKQVDPTAFYE